MLAEVLHSPMCPPSLLVEGAGTREATVVEVTCNLVISAISPVITSLEVFVGTQMHSFIHNCKPVVQGFFMRAAFSRPHCSVIQKSSHLWDPRDHHRNIMEKCPLQVDHSSGQLITGMCEWLFLNSKGVPALRQHQSGHAKVHAWKVKVIKKAIWSHSLG